MQPVVLTQATRILGDKGTPLRNLLIPVLLFAGLSAGPVLAQESTPSDTNINVSMPAPAPAPAPAPDVNVQVDAPAPAAAPVTNTESTTKETSVTKVLETPAAQDNTVMWIAGACVGALALGALMVASRGKT